MSYGGQHILAKVEYRRTNGQSISSAGCEETQTKNDG